MNESINRIGMRRWLRPKQLRGTARFRRASVFAAALPILGGCTQAHLTRMTYEVLRQEDCRRNQPEEFCSRGFAFEYHEYERLRQDYIRGQTTPASWRVSENSAHDSN